MKVHDKDGVTLYHSHSVFALMSMPSDSVDAIVTDPPYGLSFMGKKWDYDVPSVQIWTEALRVLKPGGHLLSFAGSRTYHRMAVNIEDAGFEIRDQIMWIYGSGFPKSLDISKAIDKAAGAERMKIPAATKGGKITNGVGNTRPWHENPDHLTAGDIPATPEAEAWDGWGTALKPAHEPIVVARKPIEGTVAENVLKHGTGGINIDGGRIGTEERYSMPATPKKGTFNCSFSDSYQGKAVQGRWPANIILDPEAGAMLDKQSGDCKTGDLNKVNTGIWGQCGEREGINHKGDSGGASRFFYCAKASKADRDEGLEGMEKKTAGQCTVRKENTAGLNSPRAGAGRTDGARNHHPTVKPTTLMQYLVRLVTPPGGIVLDPFMGSGSTGKAAVREGFRFIGIEREAEYIPIAIARINVPAQVTLL